MEFKEFIKKYNNKRVDIDHAYGHQCTDLLKAYTKEVLWVTLGTFWGSAKTAWYNESNTFPANKWTKITNNLNDPNQVPQAEDLIFWGYGAYWHCAIGVAAEKDEALFTVFNQNTWSWNGYWYDDRSRIETQDYNGILWWYRYKKPVTENTCIDKVVELESQVALWKVQAETSSRENSILKNTIADLENTIDQALNILKD